MLRVVGLAAALALAALPVGEARAAQYEVAQCGWGVEADADWADTTGAKFRQDAYCVGPDGADPFDGMHVKSIARASRPGVAGTRFARWRWVAPGDTGIVRVRGTWWHTLHDGMEHRLGTDGGHGGFDVFAADDRTNTSLRSFAAGFSSPRRGFQSRLLCARGTQRSCSFDPISWSSLRALTITLDDPGHPGASIGGELLGGGWLRGRKSASVGAGDAGAGVRYSETYVDGDRVGVTEFSCAKQKIGGAWEGTRMRPCPTEAGATHSLDTRKLSDGEHSAHNCSRDFAGNLGCTGAHTFRVDNGAPGLALDASADPADSGLAKARVADPHSGPASGALFYRRAGVPAWTELPTELRPAEEEEGVATLRAKLPIDLLEPGLYELRAAAADVAGNETATTRRSDGSEATFRIEPPPPPPPPPAPTAGGKAKPKKPAGKGHPAPSRSRARTRLFARLRGGGRRGRELTVRFGARALLSGRLLRAAGAGLAGRRLTVVSRPPGMPARTRRRVVVSGPRGGFRLTLPPGPSRRLVVRFAGAAGLAPARRAGLSLRVRGGVRLRLARTSLRTGQLLRIGGRVRPRATLPARGKLVAIQYFEDEARRWRPVLIAHANRAGRFRARYRFRYVSGTARIRLRAVALPEAGWPFEAGASRPRLVRVSG